MSTTDTFNDWYERMKSLITGEASPGEQVGEKLDRQARQVMARGHDRESAYAIANSTLKADLEDSQRDELLETAKEVSEYDAQVPMTFDHLVGYAGVDVKGEDDLELPKSCRRCGNGIRVKGSFMCPDCDPSVSEEKGDFELVGSGVQEAGGSDEDAETEKAEESMPPSRKVYLGHDGSEVPEGVAVQSDEKGLYYETPIEGTAEKGDVDQKADPMANGHDLDPETGEGTCSSTGETIEAETMQELTEDCPHCGEPLSVLDQKADGEGFGLDVFRVVAAPDDDTEYNGNVLGIGVNFALSGTYVDWRLEAFPDPLEDPHVSIYGSLEDLKEATGNVIEHLETHETPADVELEIEDPGDEGPEGGGSDDEDPGDEE